MAIRTRLSLTGTPGRPYGAWVAKTAYSIPVYLAGVYLRVTDAMDTLRVSESPPRLAVVDSAPVLSILDRST